MDFHPLLVHFPIALFVTYSLLELIPFKKITSQTYWFYLKAVLVVFGVFGAAIAVLSGQLIEDNYSGDRSFLSLHSHINELGSAIFAVIAFTYIIAWITQSRRKVPQSLMFFWNIFLKIETLVRKTALLYILVIAGLLCIFIGGALGGIMVYGVDMDPITKFVYTVFFKGN